MPERVDGASIAMIVGPPPEERVKYAYAEIQHREIVAIGFTCLLSLYMEIAWFFFFFFARSRGGSFDDGLKGSACLFPHPVPYYHV